MFKNKRGNNTASMLAAFTIGSLIGASVALLIAPYSGKETRRMIKDRSTELTDLAHDTADETRRRAEKAMDDLADRTKQMTEDFRQHGHEAVDKTRSKF
jgi:gas vesicle protein